MAEHADPTGAELSEPAVKENSLRDEVLDTAIT